MGRTSISASKRFEILKRDGFRCRYCGAAAPHVDLEIDHVVAVSRGGRNDPSNLATACGLCNSGKSDRDLEVRSNLQPLQKAAFGAIHDNLWTHAGSARVSLRAMGLYAIAMSRCAEECTRTIDDEAGGSDLYWIAKWWDTDEASLLPLVNELVAAGLLMKRGYGWRFHDQAIFWGQP